MVESFLIKKCKLGLH
uniref:Uncharacterized protein n=1 Tax=Anguilla anguilla TaxID=7936 RepID=A0A0E9V3T3_ANGAN